MKKSPKTGTGGETLHQESRGRKGNQEKCYATRTPCRTNKALSVMETQRRHMACVCAEATNCWTGIYHYAHEPWSTLQTQTKSRTCATDSQHCTKEHQKHYRPLPLVVNYIKYDLIVFNTRIASGGWVYHHPRVLIR